MSKGRKKKGYIERKANEAKRKIKKAARKKTRQVVRKGKTAAVNSARAAVERARKKPADIIKDMRDSGWSAQQIQARTGMSPRAQTNVLSGKTSGSQWLQPLREARRSGTKRPPANIKPVPSAKTPGAGSVRKTKTGTTITVSHTTSREWLAEQQRRARGKVRIVYTKTAKERGIGHTPPPPAPKPGRVPILKDRPPAAPKAAAPKAPPAAPPKQYRNNKLVMTNADAFERGARGAGAAKSLTWYQQCKDVLKANGGNVEAAMRQLGITSKRTWNKWTNPNPKKRTTPGPAARKKIEEIRKSPEARKKFLPMKRLDRLAKKGMKVRMRGKIAANNDPRYERVRNAEVLLPPEAAENVVNALIEGGPEAAEEAFRMEMQLHYAANETPFAFDQLDTFEMADLDDFDRARMEM